MKSPNVWVNWLQFVTSVGAFAGPRAAGLRTQHGGSDALDGT